MSWISDTHWVEMLVLNRPSVPILPASGDTNGGIPALKKLAILCCMVTAASADQFGDFTYTNNGTSITITDYPAAAAGAVIIPATIFGKPVTSIGTYAFDRCRELTSISIPSSVTSIGDYAFIYCDKLVSFGVDAANPNYSSAGGVLFNKLQTLLIQYPSGVSGSYAVPARVTSIGSWAFTESAGLTGVALPSSVASIGSFAFASCPSLASVTLSSGVSSLGPGAFYNCKILTSVTIPFGVGIIENSVFSGCIGLTSVTLPASVTQIGNFAFSYCSGLTGVNIPASVTRIGSSAFSSSGLTSLTLPAGLTHIESNAFSGCHGLMVVTIPSSVTTLGEAAFIPCGGLTAIAVDAGNPNFASEDGLLFDKPRTTLIQFPAARSGAYVIPSGVARIAKQAFENCAGLTGVTFPGSLTTIGQSAFRNCNGLTNLTIPASAKSIGSSAFMGCAGLTGITIPPGVTTVESYAFAKCIALRNVVIPASVESIETAAFSDCAKLADVSFVGNAPTMESGVFSKAASGFTIYCMNGAAGFTLPMWLGYPVIRIGNSTAVVTWLVANGFPPAANLKADSNGDGVDLLLAYALNLDPNVNLSGSMPQPVFTAGTMRLSFYGGTAGVAYTVEASGNMVDWNTNGVTLSGPDANKIRTAAVSRVGPVRFMRLAVSH